MPAWIVNLNEKHPLNIPGCFKSVNIDSQKKWSIPAWNRSFEYLDLNENYPLNIPEFWRKCEHTFHSTPRINYFMSIPYGQGFGSVICIRKYWFISLILSSEALLTFQIFRRIRIQSMWNQRVKYHGRISGFQSIFERD